MNIFEFEAKSGNFRNVGGLLTKIEGFTAKFLHIIYLTIGFAGLIPGDGKYLNAQRPNPHDYDKA
jgi:hypothetical protein